MSDYTIAYTSCQELVDKEPNTYEVVMRSENFEE